MENPIGIMLPAKDGFYRILGPCCLRHIASIIGTPIYRVNIFPYTQHCAECGKTLVKGAWNTELYDGKH